ncbi:MAG TPA: alpha/beta fold hydrolase [Burkholderiales bacterium]|nr:alpha/beta fold hydrolase [Burkholderiales bacterium]
MKKVLRIVAVAAGVVIGGIALAIAFGGPGTPAPLRSISDPFKGVDFSDLPPLEKFICRGGDPLAFREYKAAGEPAGNVVLVHGSSAHSASMHSLAKAYAKAGFRAFSLDMRGHGASGGQETIKGPNHLQYDVEDFLKATRLTGNATLVGFSSGGGFVLGFAGGPRQDLFTGYVLLAPFVSQEAPTYRPDGGGWVSVGVPRIIGLVLLNAAGIGAFNNLPVLRFAVADEMKKNLTAEYSYSLAMRFRAPPDWRRTISAVQQPMAVLVGEKDELFVADQFAPLFAEKKIPVTVVPGVNHIGLILDERALQAAVSATAKLKRP